MINILIYSVIYLKKEGLKIIVSAVQEINLLDLNLGIDFKFKYMHVLMVLCTGLIKRILALSPPLWGNTALYTLYGGIHDTISREEHKTRKVN